MTNPAVDPDVVHLFELLSMLPELDPFESSDFWDQYGELISRRSSYIRERIPSIMRSIAGGDVTPYNAADVAKLALQFFTVEDMPEACLMLDQVAQCSQPVPGAIGKVWARAVTTAAVRVYSRYHVAMGSKAWWLKSAR